MWSDVFNVKKQTVSYTSQESSGSEQLSTFGRRHRPDYWLVAICVILLLIGLVVIYSISPAMSEVYHVGSNYYVFKQLIAIVLGLLAFVIAAKIPLSWWYKFVTPILIAAAFATLLAIVMPVNPSYPAHRWVRLGNLSFESVELVKFALLLWLAKLLTVRIRTGTIKNIRLTLKPLFIALAIIGVIIAGVQSDLGSVGVIVIIIGAMLFVAGMPLKKLAIVVGVIIVGLVLLTAATPYRRERLLTYLHPTANCQGSGYQACQAIIGVGSGGMVGLGLGSSVQAYGYLPEAVNDSIFAIYAEKFGFIGVVILMAIFVALFTRLKNIAERAPDDFSRLLVVGILGWLCVQTLINVGAMIGLLPLKGITLPFISYGGTSIVFILAALGLVFQVSAYTTYTSVIGQRKRGAGHDYSSDGRRVRGSYHPYLSSSSRA